MLIGLCLAIVGLTLREAIGIMPLVAALGIGLMSAGTVYIAVEGSEIVRLSLVFLALVALSLFAHSGIVRLVGSGMAGVVVASALYTRIS